MRWSIVTRGPPLCGASLATMLVPPKPVSEEPIESVMTRLGSSSRSFSLMLGENSAAVLASRNSDDRSYSLPFVLVRQQRVEQRPRHRVAGEEQQVHLVVVNRAATPHRR